MRQAEQTGSSSFGLPSEAAVVPLLCLPRSAPLALSNAAIFQSSAGMGGCAWRPPCHVTHTGALSNSTIHNPYRRNVSFRFVSFRRLFWLFCSRIINQIAGAQQGPLIPPCPVSPLSLPILTLPSPLVDNNMPSLASLPRCQLIYRDDVKYDNVTLPPRGRQNLCPACTVNSPPKLVGVCRVLLFFAVHHCNKFMFC